MPAKVKGQVVQITADGDLLTDISESQLANAPRNESFHVQVDEHETYGLFGEEHGQPAMTLIAILGNDGKLRLHLVSDSASAMLGVGRNAPVEVSWP